MSLVKVYTDIGLKKPVILIAKICKQSPKKRYHIKYLSPTDTKHNGKRVYNYENIIYEIDDSSISEYLNTDNERDIGYHKIDDGGFIKMSDIDSDYEPSASDEDDESESESLVDEDENEEDEEEDFSEEEDDDDDE